MVLVLIKTKEAFLAFDREMRSHHGILWPVYPSPSSYPCMVAWEYFTGGCAPDHIERYIVEKWHFDHPEKCAIIDQVYG